MNKLFLLSGLTFLLFISIGCVEENNYFYQDIPDKKPSFDLPCEIDSDCEGKGLFCWNAELGCFDEKCKCVIFLGGKK